MSDIDQVDLTTLLGTSDIDQVDLTTLLGTLRFYSRFRGEIPPSICAQAADRIAELEAENFALAAHQCQSPAGDEFGHFYCARIAELEARIAELQARRWSMSESQR